mmetsp:Transcript_8263/g.30477  ORF Transcript_8263/g.30477 Transcript_8263/m.30477 type:complete len:423 (+) Transcript_8263:215-1483(+)
MVGPVGRRLSSRIYTRSSITHIRAMHTPEWRRCRHAGGWLLLLVVHCLYGKFGGVLAQVSLQTHKAEAQKGRSGPLRSRETRLATDKLMTLEEAEVVKSCLQSLSPHVGTPLEYDEHAHYREPRRSPLFKDVYEGIEELSNILELLPETGHEKSVDKYLPSLKNPCWWPHRSSPLANESIGLVCLPYFYILGPQKCGTTDLYDRIVAHPEVLRATSKEPQWWTQDLVKQYEAPLRSYTNTYIALRNLAMYSILEDPGATSAEGYPFQNKIMGDGSATMLYLTLKNGWLHGSRYTVPAVLYAAQPRAHLLTVLRNPVDRLYSGYNYFFGRHNPAVVRMKEQKLGTSLKNLPRCPKPNADEDYPPMLRSREPSPENFHLVVKYQIEQFNKCLEEQSVAYCVHSAQFGDIGIRVCPWPCLFCCAL